MRPALGVGLRIGSALVALAAGIAAGLATPTDASHPHGAGRPNIVFILTDDQRVDQFSREIMHETYDAIVDPGTTFETALAAPPLCCPYRAGFLTGQYPHNNGVDNTDTPSYDDLLDKGNVFPEWLRRAGYRTGQVGKYLNRFESQAGPEPPPGWDEWFSVWLGSGMQDPRVNDNGVVRSEGGYLTHVLTERAVDFIADSTGPRPFFLWLDHLSPHAGAPITESCGRKMAQPTAREYARFAGPSFASVKRPSFNERDIADKPRWVRQRARFTSSRRAWIRRAWRCAVSSLYAVDRGVGEVVEALKRTGELDDTILVFGSDNGFFYGEHRLRRGKARPYEEAFQVPFAIRVPEHVIGTEPPSSVDATITQLDLTATLLELANASPCVGGECRRLDGRSFAPFLRGGAPWGQHRGVLYELYEPCRRRIGIRTDRHAYWQLLPRCGTRGRELYNLRRDPYQLNNLAGKQRAKERNLRRRTLSLRKCSGIRGREEQLPGVPFCR